MSTLTSGEQAVSESNSSTAWDRLAALLVLFSLAFLLFAAALPSDQLLSFRDAGHLYLAIKTRTADALRAGQLPTWEERMGCGWPFLADPVSQVLYPANLLFLFLSPVQGLKYFVLLHLAGAGWASCCWPGNSVFHAPRHWSAVSCSWAAERS